MKCGLRSGTFQSSHRNSSGPAPIFFSAALARAGSVGLGRYLTVGGSPPSEGRRHIHVQR